MSSQTESQMLKWATENSNSFNSFKEFLQVCPYTPRSKDDFPRSRSHRQIRKMKELKAMVRKILALQTTCPPAATTYSRRDLKKFGYRINSNEYSSFHKKRTQKEKKNHKVQNPPAAKASNLNGTEKAALVEFERFHNIHQLYDDFRKDLRQKELKLPLILNKCNSSLGSWLVQKRHCTANFYGSPNTVKIIDTARNMPSEWQTVLYIKLCFVLMNTNSARSSLSTLVRSLEEKLLEPENHMQLQQIIYDFLNNNTNTGEFYLGNLQKNPVAAATYFEGGITGLTDKKIRLQKVARNAAIIASNHKVLGISQLQKLCVSRCLVKLEIPHNKVTECWTDYSAIEGVNKSLQTVSRFLELEEADVEHGGCEFRKFKNNSGLNYDNEFLIVEDQKNCTIISRRYEVIDLGDDDGINN